MLNMNMKVLFVANKYFSSYKYFCVALKSHLTTSFDFFRKYSIVKPDVWWANIGNFTDRAYISSRSRPTYLLF